ncbi:MAG: arsenate reductase ArsC [Chloroflexi bacterium]|nr:arsenate reductase ArsC [Chloroflexota bacterium]
MAEAWFRSLSAAMIHVRSAGIEPSGYIHPMAEEVMLERGVSLGNQSSKSVDRFVNQRFDYVITVCAEAEDACPVFPGAAEKIHWDFKDPARSKGSESERLEKFRQVRDELQNKIAEFLQQLNPDTHPDPQSSLTL